MGLDLYESSTQIYLRFLEVTELSWRGLMYANRIHSQGTNVLKVVSHKTAVTRSITAESRQRKLGVMERWQLHAPQCRKRMLNLFKTHYVTRAHWFFSVYRIDQGN